MKARFLSRPLPCIITALELLGVDDLTMGKARNVFGILEHYLGEPEQPRVHETYLSVTAHRVIQVAPIRGGVVPFRLALDMSYLQRHLFPLGVLVRGAIALGTAAIADGTLIVGQGVAEAQRLCDEVARIPRVIVDPHLLREVERNANLRKRQHSVMAELGYLRSMLRSDTDGLWFVDYLWALRSEGTLTTYLELLKEHHRLVTRKLEVSTVLDRASQASTWLWNYHNLIVDELKVSASLTDQELAELRVAATSPLVYNFPPSAKAP
jgi:hypothetical protein